jgi:hypothetical protein
MEAMWVFIPQFDSWQVWNSWVDGTFKSLSQFPTAAQCEQAQQLAKEHVIRTSPQADQEWRIQDIDEVKRKYCDTAGDYAGKPLSHNHSLAVLMGLIELWRVLDSGFYRNSPARVSGAEFTHGLIPIIVARGQHYFFDSLQLIDAAQGQHYRWLYGDGVPDPGDPDWEDTGHANLDMFYLNVLWQSLPRLNAEVPPGEPIMLDNAIRQRFANTFVQQIARPQEIDLGGNLRGNVNGDKPHDSAPDDIFNHTWDGWVHLADANPTVFRMCLDVGLRTDAKGYFQPYLTIGNHAALLVNKREITATPPPAECRVGSKCCEFAPSGSCSKCVLQRMQCP